MMPVLYMTAKATLVIWAASLMFLISGWLARTNGYPLVSSLLFLTAIGLGILTFIINEEMA